MNTIKKLDTKRIAKNISNLLVSSNNSYEEIAFMLGISPRVLYYWQSGKRTPSTECIYGLSQLFNVPIESILA